MKVNQDPELPGRLREELDGLRSQLDDLKKIAETINEANNKLAETLEQIEYLKEDIAIEDSLISIHPSAACGDRWKGNKTLVVDVFTRPETSAEVDLVDLLRHTIEDYESKGQYNVRGLIKGLIKKLA